MAEKGAFWQIISYNWLYLHLTKKTKIIKFATDYKIVHFERRGQVAKEAKNANKVIRSIAFNPMAFTMLQVMSKTAKVSHGDLIGMLLHAQRERIRDLKEAYKIDIYHGGIDTDLMHLLWKRDMHRISEEEFNGEMKELGKKDAEWTPTIKK